MSVTENFDPMDNQYFDDEDFDDDMPPPTARRRLPALTAALLVAIVATAGFFAGVVVQKHAGKVQTSSSVKITKTDTGSVADLKPGATIVVTGDAGPDGTVTATAISLGALGG